MIGAIRIVMGEGFRAFFLAAGLFAILSMAIWLAWLAFGGWFDVLAPLPPQWHGHEMIFGYAGAALGGFFLTAVPSWTGAPAARRAYIVTAAGTWLAGRFAIAFSGMLDPFLVAVADLTFIPLLGIKIALQLTRRPKPQNVMFLGLLTIIWAGNVAFHMEALGILGDGARTGLRAGLFGIAAIIAAIGGRVTPGFTRNAMTQEGIETGLPRSRGPADIAGIGSAILLPILMLADAPDGMTTAVALTAGAAQIFRLSGWRSLWTLGQPILWSLHLGFAMLGVSYVMSGLAYLDIVQEAAALHLMGIGAIGGMTLAVMSRAILGHSGLPLVASWGVTLAYLLVASAAVLRAIVSSLPPHLHDSALIVAGGLWITAFLLFVIEFWPIVTRPRSAAGSSA